MDNSGNGDKHYGIIMRNDSDKCESKQYKGDILCDEEEDVKKDKGGINDDYQDEYKKLSGEL